MSKHTPGPWKIITSWNDYMVEGPDGEEIIWQDGNYDTPTISLENACLIAAAPSLLEALEDAVSTQPADSPIKWVLRARSAIAKARGEQ